MEFIHEPVLLQEVLEWMDVKPDGVYCDGTLGGGGHSGAMLRLSGGTATSNTRFTTFSPGTIRRSWMCVPGYCWLRMWLKCAVMLSKIGSPTTIGSMWMQIGMCSARLMSFSARSITS